MLFAKLGNAEAALRLLIDQCLPFFQTAVLATRHNGSPEKEITLSEIDEINRWGLADAYDSSASRQLMINTLKAFGNQVRIRGLLGEIEAAADLEELKNLLPRWYQAIAETPNGMYQADDLRKDLKKLMGV